MVCYEKFNYGLTGILIDKELYNFFTAYLLNVLKAFSICFYQLYIFWLSFR